MVFFPLSSTIDKSEFFSYRIEQLTFSPNELTLLMDSSRDTFANAHTELMIKTDIPESDDSIRFQLFMQNREASCYDVEENRLSNDGDFSHLFINEEELLQQVPLKLSFNKVAEERKTGLYPVILTFDSLPKDASFCQGYFSLYAELSL
ncbi:TPA: hypothetical protein I7671_04320 [Vibrio vulnificus]|nr:hypothetical protein [Vibrio vulnificus]